MKVRHIKMKYVTPIIEKTMVETKDVLTASTGVSVVERNNSNGTLGADFSISFSDLFSKY